MRKTVRISATVLSLFIFVSFLMVNFPAAADSGDYTGGMESFDHDHNYTPAVTKPTCTEKGYTTYTCSVCNDTYIADYIDANGHTAVNWVFDETYHWKVCSVCQEVIYKAAHTESEWIIDIPATTEAGGHRHKECTVCGLYTKEEDTAKLSGAYIPGDINGDGAVNNKDLTRLFQYLSDWDVEVNDAALDVNGDGSVNNKDLTRLFQYLSDWDVEIF